MAGNSPNLGESARPAGSPWRWGLAVGAAALVWFLAGLPTEPHFVDESAYFSQSYYADLIVQGTRAHTEWLAYPAYDLPPLPKYLIGGALALAGFDRPGPDAARRWYADTSTRFERPGALEAARVPSALLGALGCVALFGLGTLLRNVRTGVTAALLLMANPLYRSHARRAMSDVPAEAFVALALWLALWIWREALEGRMKPTRWVATATAGVAAGLAVLCKFTGVLAMLVLIAWAGLALCLPGYSFGRKWRLIIAIELAGAVSLATFFELNPFMTAHPKGTLPPEIAYVAGLDTIERGRLLVRQRLDVSNGQQRLFPHNAVVTPGERARVVAVQGFGRFGPFGPAHDDSTRRYDLRQDWGAFVWLPWVFAGAVWAGRRGRAQRREGRAPTAWAVLAQAISALAVITYYLPLAWNRYFLPLQTGSALLAAGVAVAAFERIRPLRQGA